MTQVTGRQVIGAASIVGVAVIAGSMLLARSLNNVTQQLDSTVGRLEQIRVAVNDAKDSLGNLQAARPAEAPRRGPDPNRRYTINTEGAPAVGPQTAKVTVVEFSDFQ